MTALDRVYISIWNYWRENAIPPVIREVQQMSGVRSTSDVSGKYRKLEKQGRIKIVKGHPVPVEIEKLIKGDLPR